MNKEALINLRSQLISQMSEQKKYVIGGTYGDVDIPDDFAKNNNIINNVITKKDILEKSSTKEAIDFLEKGAEELLRELIKKGYDVTTIYSGCEINCFFSEDYHKMISYQEKNDEKISSPIGSDVLDDYIYLKLNLGAHVLNNSVLWNKLGFGDFTPEETVNLYDLREDLAEKYKKYFIVKYSEFLYELRRLSYEIEIKNFNEIVEAELYYDEDILAPTIDIDLDKPSKQHQR